MENLPVDQPAKVKSYLNLPVARPAKFHSGQEVIALVPVSMLSGAHRSELGDAPWIPLRGRIVKRMHERSIAGGAFMLNIIEISGNEGYQDKDKPIFIRALDDLIQPLPTQAEKVDN